MSIFSTNYNLKFTSAQVACMNGFTSTLENPTNWLPKPLTPVTQSVILRQELRKYHKETHEYGGTQAYLSVLRLDAGYTRKGKGDEVRLCSKEERGQSAQGLLCSTGQNRADEQGRSARKAGCSQIKIASSVSWHITIKFTAVSLPHRGRGKIARDKPKITLPILSIQRLRNKVNLLCNKNGRMESRCVHD